MYSYCFELLKVTPSQTVEHVLSLCQLARTMSLQVMGNVESGAKVVLWTETRVPVQTWSAQVSGTISSITFPGMVLDIKGEI